MNNDIKIFLEQLKVNIPSSSDSISSVKFDSSIDLEPINNNYKIINNKL